MYEENKGDDPLIETSWKYCEILSKEIFHVARYLLGHNIVKIERITKMNEQAHRSDTR